MKIFRKECIWVTLFLTVVAIFFYPTILRGKIPVPGDTLVGLYYPWRDLYSNQYPQGIPFKNFLITDPIRQQIPWRKAAIEDWKQGKLPRWNPFSFSGTALNANIQAAVFYPGNLLFFLFSFPVAWTLLIILEPVLSGLFLYAYLKHQKLSSWASVLGAIVWSFCGFSTAWLAWGTIVHAALWLPLILLALDVLLESAKFNFRWGFIVLLSLTMSFFAGHTQVFFYVLLLSVCYGIWKLARVSPFFKKSFLTNILWIAGVFIVLTAIQWIPFLHSILESSRFSDFASWKEPGWFLPWQNLVQFISPDFFGNPTTLNYWGIWNYGEFIGYIGIVSLIFAFYAMISKTRDVLFWNTVLFVTLVFLLPNPVSRIIYQLHIPILSAMQPTRLMVLVDFALAVLTGIGADHFMRQTKKSTAPVLGILASMLALLWLIVVFFLKRGSTQDVLSHFLVAKNNLVLPTALFIASAILLLFWKRTGKSRIATSLFQIATLALISFDLLRFGWKFTPFTPIKYFFPTTQTLVFLEKQPKPFRIAVLDNRVLPPNTSSYYGLESIEGYDPIYQSRYEEFIAASERGKPDIAPPYGFNRIITPHNIDSPIIPLLSARFVLSFDELQRPFLTKVFQEGNTFVYEDTRSVPRAYFVEQVSLEKDKQALIGRLFSKDFQPRREAIVESSVNLIPAPVQSGETVQITSYNNSEIRLEVQAINNRFLVIANMYDFGWQAEIDGKQTILYRTDYLFQGIVVPSGRHTIILRYRG